MKDLLASLKVIVRLPIFALAVVVGILEAIASDTAIFLLTVACACGLAFIGPWTLFPTFAIYAILRSFATVFNALTEQVNFLARVYRDNA